MDTLRQAGVKVTLQRALIFQALENSEKPLSAAEVAQVSGISQASIYRALELLVEEGLAYSLNSAGKTWYAACKTTQHHHHLICNYCKNAVEASSPELEVELSRLAVAVRFRVTDHELTLHGICAKCQENHPEAAYKATGVQNEK